MKRRTIKNVVSREGIGIHTGKLVRITFKPYDNGIIIFNTARDNEKRHPIKISPFKVVDTKFATTIFDKYPIITIEHILSALHGLKITDLIIEITADEPPVFDGASVEYVNMILNAGIQELDEEIEFLQIKYPVWYIKNDTYIIGLPDNDFVVSYSIDFSHKSKAVGYQFANFKINEDSYINEIAPARTFGFYEDIEFLREKNLAQGGSLENVVVFTKDKYLNNNLRFENEPVRHKILDIIGDLYLLTIPIKGHIIAHKAGHTSDVEFTKKLFFAHQAELTNKKIREIEKEFKKIQKKLQLPI